MRTSNVEHRTSNIEPKRKRGGYVRPEKRKCERRTSNFELRTSNIEPKRKRGGYVFSQSRVGKRCHAGANLGYAAVVRVGAFYCVGFLLIVNEKPETSGFSLFIRPAGGSPAGEFFLLVRFDAIRRLSFFGLDGRFPRVWSRLVSRGDARCCRAQTSLSKSPRDRAGC